MSTNQPAPHPKVIARLYDHLVEHTKLDRKGTKSVRIFLSPKEVVKLTHQIAPAKRNRTNQTFLLTIGKPNFVESLRIGAMQRRGETFPSEIQVVKYPVKRVKSTKGRVSTVKKTTYKVKK